MIERSARALLGVSPSATTGQIKRAYRRLALDVHPDRGGDPAAFQRLVEAQNVLLARPTSAHAPSRSAWLDTSVVERPSQPRRSEFRQPTRPPARVQAAPSRSFGDVLAEKLAAA